MNRLVLIDGNAVMHRAYHALPPLTSPDGKIVHVVYGFVSMMIKIIHDLKPTHMAVAFDRPGKTFRDDLYANYQIQRPKMDDDFISQIALVHEVVKASNVPIFELDGFEADDMIGTIVQQVLDGHTEASEGAIDQVVIITGDRDILQLVVDEKILVFMPTKGLSEGKLYGENEVVERMGVKPSLIIDLKALMGDASDNYPGVAGIGPKTALQLLKDYGSVESIYAHIDSIGSAGIKAKLIAGHESAVLGKTLATIRRDAPIVFIPQKAMIHSLDTPALRTALEAFHFSSLFRRLTGEEPNKVQVAKREKKDTKEQKNDDTQQTLF